MSRALDPEALARLRELDPGGRRGFLPQVLRAYDVSLRRHLARLRPADGSGVDAKTAAEVAHTLKSSSTSVGALDFARCCVALEQVVKSGGEVDMEPALLAVLEEGEHALEAVRAMLRD